MWGSVLPTVALASVSKEGGGSVNNWAPLWSGLVDSSIWEEPDHVFRVFMAMMSLKDSNHVVSMDGYRLAKRIHMPLETVENALKTLSEPDQKRPGQEFEGRRIKRVDDGWEIINGEYYRKLVSEEMKRVRNRRAQANWRENQKVRKGKTRERGRSVDAEARAFERSIENGEPESEQDKIVTNSLPEKCRDQLPDVGKVMVPNGISESVEHPLGSFHVDQPTDERPVELLLAKPRCDCCGEVGHKGEDCPIPAHLEGGKWVRD